jgi:thiamine-monophosphate kinase
MRVTPRFEQGRWLAARAGVHAAIDVSDGLAQDAGHIAEASGLSLALSSGMLPEDPELVARAGQLPKSATEYMLYGGESYELAVALDAAEADDICRDFTACFGMPLTVAGTFSSGAGEMMMTLDGKRIKKGGFDHFGG